MRPLTTKMKSGDSNEAADKYNNSNNNSSNNNSSSSNNGAVAEVATTSGANVINLFMAVSYEFIVIS